MGRRVLRRVPRRGSKKGLSRRHLEGRTPFREYDPLGVRPSQKKHDDGQNCCILCSYSCTCERQRKFITKIHASLVFHVYLVLW